MNQPTKSDSENPTTRYDYSNARKNNESNETRQRQRFKINTSCAKENSAMKPTGWYSSNAITRYDNSNAWK